MNNIKTLAIAVLALSAAAASAEITLPDYMSNGEKAFLTYFNEERPGHPEHLILYIRPAERIILARLLVNGTVKDEMYDFILASYENRLKSQKLSDEKFKAILSLKKEAVALNIYSPYRCWDPKQSKIVETLLRAHPAEVLEELRKLKATWLYKYIVRTPAKTSKL